MSNNEHQESTPSTLREAMKEAMNYFRSSVELVVMIAVFSIVIMSITEMVGRQQFLALLSSQVDDIEGELIELSVGNSELPQRVDALREQLKILNELHSETMSLIAIGAQRDHHTLHNLRDRRAESAMSAWRAVDPQTGASDSNSADHLGAQSPSRLWYYKMFDISLYGNDILLAVVVIGCGGIGSVIASLRAEQRLTSRALMLGFASGLVTFLAIKGGRYIFLIQAGGNDIAFNPYSSAFAGILVGLFTDRAHALLTDLVDHLSDRFKTAVLGE